jgi:hypothetical protein
MRSDFFKGHGFTDADYDFDAGSSGNLPIGNFRAPGRSLQMIALTGVYERSVISVQPSRR